MSSYKWRVASGVAVAVLVAVTVLYWRSQQPTLPATEIVALQSAQGAAGFARVTEPRAQTSGLMQFPRDHGAHLDYQTEWWYYTGNLQAADGRRFGYQLTFFRRGITPGKGSEPPCRGTPGCAPSSDWRTNQIFFAHFAITDAGRNEHNESEIFSRGAAGLAGAVPNDAEPSPFHVWIENWAARSRNADASQVQLTADDGERALALTLDAVKPPVVHGKNGISQKSDTPGNASYYVSFTRMTTQGTLRVDGETVPVTGTSWFDHEWGTTGLGANAAGWDWFSIQLDDNRTEPDRLSELMFFQIRNKDGSIEPLSSGTLVKADGSAVYLARADVEINVLERWTSRASGGSYPSRWRLTSERGNFDLTLTPLIADQEMRVSFTYWEGAVNVTGTSNGKPVRGQGYVEMTGYATQARGDVGY